MTDWTYDVSAAGWTRSLAAIEAGTAPDQTILVAEQGGLIGLAAARMPAQSIVDVGALYIAFDHQKQGLGRALVETIKSRYAARGATAMHIGVLKANEPARRFHERIGGKSLLEREFDEAGVPLPEIVYGWPLPA
ncbi:MAG: GNAT family N-acetyltransferase [Dehalococcoidia bacterium]|nr:GNAT family N-acetyltransferase [Dehalococcoidia bacterium]